MPLSEEELRLLDQMERALVEEDPKFASTLRGTSIRQSARRRAIFAGVAFAIGVTVLMTGAVTQLVYVGIIGFVLMLASATIALGTMGAQRQAAGSGEQRSTGHGGFSVIDGGKRGAKRGRVRGRTRTRTSGTFMERIDARWRRRRERGGF
ncbi:hypothetical protein BH11ACT8_BH11ACT8_35270 [soil metagenome]